MQTEEITSAIDEVLNERAYLLPPPYILPLTRVDYSNPKLQK